MRFDLITLFPEMLSAITGQGITKRAVDRGLVDIHHWNPRDFTEDRHRTVDDRPYGGGPGMVMLYEPLKKAICQARDSQKESGISPYLIYLSPQGKPLTQGKIEELSKKDGMLLLAGRYEGIDERLIESEVDEEISIGDYVVSGGELPAMVLMDAVIRLVPGALGHADSAAEDSFSDALLDHPHYSRPEEVDGRSVPEVLLSGNHQAIAEWRREQAELRTKKRRPDIL
ncbi:MAG: tRNA (guanosine(37)-N1)-methyltransferase TrmD [Gammaproteobacteria bacterium]|uniref:tRNA (guanine-N(1)-)-methyltransferase n=1 Tax=Candidatus Thiopontia autotrophica TaxID=2841688 RepID=A0A8J6TNG7_9GAMM|nr:tRNA (guanosine(37)-N1)-methyltransferase TrmD [Candidatus Thiopontia autotrophica]MBL6968767.1 tRNA (guanosine(37)-N1)-methyltransferase TrmD [Gammaproteobacteria bacterium]